MDQSKSLQKLTESADLVAMVEDLLRVSQNERLTPATLAGMRLTLKNIKESILQSHDYFANDLVNRTRTRAEMGAAAAPLAQGATKEIVTTNRVESVVASQLTDQVGLGARRSLRSAIEMGE